MSGEPAGSARRDRPAVPDQAALLRWFEAQGRQDLPWRATRDPWSVLVAEVMLQQTQVSRVLPRFAAFLADFPTARACAGSPVAAVIEHWDGLGYNRRAVNLWRAAGVVTDRFDGVFPPSLSALQELPGVGPYTARAVLAFAFEHDVGVVDTNAARVLARWVGRSLTRSEVQQLADAAVPPARGWSWNQAMLDLGATVCTARPPNCGACPLRHGCGWFGSDSPDPDPAVGSAGVSGGQSRFAGSDRQGRGRLVRALRAGPVPVTELAPVMGWPDDVGRAERVAATLVVDGLAVLDDGRYRLPG